MLSMTGGNAVLEEGAADRLLWLAREVELAVPGDSERALSCLMLMGRALSVPPRADDDRAVAAWSDPRVERQKLSYVVAELERSVGRGQVLAIRGLERQVERYLGTLAREDTRALVDGGGS
jgi:hypothetical protein